MQDASGKAEEFLGRLQTRISAEDRGPEGLISYSEVLGRRVRSGDLQDQKVGTIDKIVAALDAQDFSTAAELADFFIDEAAVIFGIYRDWVPKLIDFLRERGIDDEELTALNEQILSLLTTPEGRPFHARRMWGELQAKIRELVLTCGRADAVAALEQLEDVHKTWITLHDHDVDISQYSWAESLPTNLYLAMEAMRGHAVGPGRRGNFEFEEDEDRYTFRFDPCGSGGHTLRGEQEVFGTPPRMEPPYNWKVLEEEHDFGWNKKGVCLYCTNCCVVMQKKPIEEYGYPVRVVEPPTYPDDKDAKCTWHIYKDPANIPERYYEDVGAKKPEHLKGGGDV